MKRTRAQAFFGERAGTTLTELMVAVVVMSIGILGLFGAFQFISRSLFVSRAQTLATNLGQEKIEVLKNLTYYDLLLTTTSASDPRFSPSIPYDTVNYPPETVTIANIQFTRYTYVTLVNVSSGNIVSVGSNYPDTGLKQITVSIVWTDKGGVAKKWTLTNLLENPAVNPLDATINGNVTIAGGGGPLAGAVVKVEQNKNWSATTDASGNYTFQVYHGSYTVRASSAGFYDAISTSTIVVARGATATRALSLQAIATGTVSGNAWYNPGLVISEVVGTTHTCTGVTCTGANVDDVEYLELFNPTTYQISIVTPPGGASPWNSSTVTELIKVYTMLGGSSYNDILGCAGASCVYVSSYVAPGGYYLIANHSTFFVNGTWVTADAYYGNTNCGGGSPTNCIANDAYGGIQVKDNNSNIIDRVCWRGNGGTPPTAYCNGTYIPLDATCGMNTGYTGGGTCTSPTGNAYLGNQLVRFSSPTVLGRAMFAGTYGGAYNSQNNPADFTYPVSGSAATLGLNYNPFTTASPILPVIAGVPAVGADVAATDPYSASTKTVSASVTNAAPWSQSQIFAPFVLAGVTTGTWSIDIATTSGGGSQFFAHIDTITVTQGVSTAVPNGGTSPPWTLANDYAVMLTTTSVNGYVKGTVTDANNNPINVTVQSGGYTTTSGSAGRYFLSVTSGPITLTANPNALNPSYVSEGFPLNITQSSVTVQNFVLSLGARLTGYCTTGTTPIPNQVVNALNGGSQMGTGTSDATGDFSINGVTTGTYTITPVLNAGQSSTPANVVVNVTSTGTVFIGTFTVTGAYGTISGTVTDNSALVTTGALIIASTSAISSTPPAIYGSSAPAQVPVYMISSKADGSYSLPVRSASSYNLSVYIPVVSNAGVVTITTKTYSGISVSAGGSTTKNVVLP